MVGLNRLRSYLCWILYIGVCVNILNWLEWKTTNNVFDDDDVDFGIWLTAGFAMWG